MNQNVLSIEKYNEVRDCIYKDEYYSVRDNGAILRHQREGMSKRKLDEIWSFGTPNMVTGYMDFCGERVHRIVATAFHGPAPSEQHVVDHIDTNRRNNRPENLRWLTKLENILCNEITRKKIELICGSIEAFLENPKLLYGHETIDSNFKWMKNVTKEEAKNCLENWRQWAKNASPNPDFKSGESQLGDWLFDKPVSECSNSKASHHVTTNTSEAYDEDNYYEPEEDNTIDTNEWLAKTFGVKEEIEKASQEEDFIYDSLTSSAKQYLWTTPTEFPCCPSQTAENGLELYKDNLKEGNVFSKNIYGTYYVIDKAVIPDKNMLAIISTNNGGEGVYRSYSVSGVKIDKGFFIHISFRCFSTREEATHYYKVQIGEEVMTKEDEIYWDT